MGNFISGNGADTEDAATPGTAGINVYSVAAVYQTQILENTVQNEAMDVVMNHPGGMDVHLNNLLGAGVGVANLGKGAVNATMNFFGCAGGARGHGLLHGERLRRYVLAGDALARSIGTGAASAKGQ